MYSNFRLLSRMVLFISCATFLTSCNKKDDLLDKLDDMTVEEAQLIVESTVADFKTQQTAILDAKQTAKVGTPVVAGKVSMNKISSDTWVYNPTDSSYVGQLSKTNGTLGYVCYFYNSQGKKQTQYNALTTVSLKWKTTANVNFNYQVLNGAQPKFAYTATYTNLFTVTGLSTLQDSILINGETGATSATTWKTSSDSLTSSSSAIFAGKYSAVTYAKNQTTLIPQSGSISYTVNLFITRLNGKTVEEKFEKTVLISFSKSKTVTVTLENYKFTVDLEAGTVTKQ